MNIRKVCVLGSGVMGSQIAAHLINAGCSVALFDLDQETVSRGIDACKSLKPEPFFNKKMADQIKLYNYRL